MAFTLWAIPSLLAYLALFDLKFQAWGAALAARGLNARPGTGFFAQGVAPLTAAISAMIGVIELAAGPGDAKLVAAPLLIGPGAWLLGQRLLARADRVEAARARQPSLGSRIQVRCPACGTQLRVQRVTAGVVICPRCLARSPIHIRPALLPGVVGGVVIVSLWLFAVDPGNAGASPIAVAAWSLICAALCIVSPPFLEASRREHEKSAPASAVFEELRTAFLVMAATAIVFAVLNLAIPRLASVQVQDMTVREFLDFQTKVHDWSDRLGKAKLGLWSSTISLGLGALLLILGAGAWADRLQAGRKVFGKALKYTSVALLCASGFSLAGVAGVTGLRQTLSKTFQLETLSKPGLSRAVDEMGRQVATEAVRRSLNAPGAAKPACGDDTSASCLPLATSLRSEATQAKRYGLSWSYSARGKAGARSPSQDLGSRPKPFRLTSPRLSPRHPRPR